MCTAISFSTKDHYFGRNLDLEYTYDEKITITPRNMPLKFRHHKTIKTHYAIIGMATIISGYPLYYDAMNEKGLAVAGLNFPGNAVYRSEQEGMENITPFEFILWILSKCSTVSEAEELIKITNIISEPFSMYLPLTPLHFMICDKNRSITVEPLKHGLRVYENQVGVLTNNPTFDKQVFNLNNYAHLSNTLEKGTFANTLPLVEYSNGLGAIGLPGDLSSMSRFVRAAYTKLSSVCDDSENESVSQFFHILSSVAHTKGTVNVSGKYEITLYTSCMNLNRGIYYYTAYNNHQITAVDMHNIDLDGTKLTAYTLINTEQIKKQN